MKQYFESDFYVKVNKSKQLMINIIKIENKTH